MPGDALDEHELVDEVGTIERELEAEAAAHGVPDVRRPSALVAQRVRGRDEVEVVGNPQRAPRRRSAIADHDAFALREPVHETRTHPRHPSMSRDATTSFARTLVDEWVRNGVTDACLAPGSRSAPLALALAGDDRIRLHVHLDERSASFFALGLAKASGRPAVVLCTSGTAAANFHPAVLEAHHARVPLIVCTADRPPELRDTGAGQTIDQVKLYGDAVRWFCDAGRARRSRGRRARRGARWRRERSPTRSARPPVPCTATSRSASRWCPPASPLVDAPGRSEGRPWTARAPGVRARATGCSRRSPR